MSTSFAEIVEGIKGLSLQEKLELQELIEKYLIEERITEIHDNYVQSVAELNEGKVGFSSDNDRLRAMLSND